MYFICILKGLFLTKKLIIALFCLVYKIKIRLAKIRYLLGKIALIQIRVLNVTKGFDFED